MPDAAVSIIIPWLDRGDARRRAVADFVIAYYQSLGLGEVVIGDYPDDGRPLNRSRLRNEGAKKATGDILVFSDADCIVPREQLVEAIRLATKAPGAVLPYDRAVTNVREHDVNDILYRNAPPWGYVDPSRASYRSQVPLPDYWHAGPIYAMRRETFDDGRRLR